MFSTRDRFQELENGRNSVYEPTTNGQCEEVDDDEIAEIYKKFQYITSLIKCVKDDTSAMKNLFNQPTFYVSKAMQDRMESLITSSTNMTKQITVKIREIEGSIDFNCENETTQNRIKLVQYLTTRKMLEEVTNDHTQFLEKYREKQISLVKQQAKLTKHDLTAEELEACIDNEFSIFTDNLIADTMEAKQALTDLKTRHKELIRIENSLRELRDAFNELGKMVYNQQGLIDRIEYYSNQASNYVDNGTEQLLDAKTKKRKRKKRMFKLMAFGTVSLIVILVILVAF